MENKMIVNVYSVFDCVADSVMYIFDALNDGMAIRSHAPQLSKTIPLGDVKLYCIGTLDSRTNEIVPHAPRLVSWDSYKFPTNPLAPSSREEVAK